jgi:hypothetical protein
VNSARMIRLRRAVPLVPCMSIAASRLTFTAACSHTEARLRATAPSTCGVSGQPLQGTALPEVARATHRRAC